jgi:hypothetical protein
VLVELLEASELHLEQEAMVIFARMRRFASCAIC